MAQKGWWIAAADDPNMMINLDEVAAMFRDQVTRTKPTSAGVSEINHFIAFRLAARGAGRPSRVTAIDQQASIHHWNFGTDDTLRDYVWDELVTFMDFEAILFTVPLQP